MIRGKFIETLYETKFIVISDFELRVDCVTRGMRYEFYRRT
jgi:hypothetical protein